MARMIKGFALVACVGAVALFSGCGKRSEYKGLMEDMKDLMIESIEVGFKKEMDKELEKFDKLSEEEQDKLIKEGKEALKKSREALKKYKNGETDRMPLMNL